MGLDQKITFAESKTPSWRALAERLSQRGLLCQLRMIDGELAFPDETPPDAWRELRLSTPHGMVTLRREADGVRVVTWGNADAGLLADRDAIARGIAEMTDGTLPT